MQPERRSTPRGKPQELSYIQFEPEGGGIVVNASEQGLAFHAAAPLRQPGPVQLRVSPNPTQQIKLTAEIAWMDLTNKSGGLRFTEISADARNQIREWLTKTRESVDADGKLLVPSGTPKEEMGACSEARDRTDLLLSSRARNNAMPSSSDTATLSLARFRGVPSKTLMQAPFSQEKQIAISRQRLLHRFATGFLYLVLVFTAFVFLQSFRIEIGNSLIRLGEKLAGRNDAQADVPSPAQISEPSPSASTPSVPDPIPVAPANGTLAQDDSAALLPSTQPTGNPADLLPANRGNSPQHSPEARSRRGRSDLARQLWSALGAGDSSAEVALAQLYLTGNGVPRNCEQARVLLRAAAKNGNTEAQLELRKLNSSTCR
jgi:PilZ domain